MGVWRMRENRGRGEGETEVGGSGRGREWGIEGEQCSEGGEEGN